MLGAHKTACRLAMHWAGCLQGSSACRLPWRAALSLPPPCLLPSLTNPSTALSPPPSLPPHLPHPCSGFHISEDVFAGYNHVQRSASVKFKVGAGGCVLVAQQVRQPWAAQLGPRSAGDACRVMREAPRHLCSWPATLCEVGMCVM